MKYIIREGTVRGQGRYWTAMGTKAERWSEDRRDAFRYLTNTVARMDAEYEGGRVVRVTTKAERAVREERAAIVKDLRAMARGPLKIMNAWEAQLSAACEMRILELSDRIERGEVG